MKLQRFIFACLPTLLILTVGCSVPNGERAAGSNTSSTHDIQSSESSSTVSSYASGSAVSASSSATSAVSSQQSSSRREGRAKNSIPESASSKSKINGVVLFRETPGVHGIFWLGMTESEAVGSMKANNIIPERSKKEDRDQLGAIIETDPSFHSFGIFYSIYTTGFLTLEFNKDKKLIYFASKYPPQDWQKEGQEISSTYVTEKGVKLHDSFDAVEKLYGKPMAIINTSPLIYSYKLSDGLYVAFRGIKQNGANEIDLFEYSFNNNFNIYI